MIGILDHACYFLNALVAILAPILATVKFHLAAFDSLDMNLIPFEYGMKNSGYSGTLPSGYQITQARKPIAMDARLDLSSEVDAQ